MTRVPRYLSSQNKGLGHRIWMAQASKQTNNQASKQTNKQANKQTKVGMNPNISRDHFRRTSRSFKLNNETRWEWELRRSSSDTNHCPAVGNSRISTKELRGNIFSPLLLSSENTTHTAPGPAGPTSTGGSAGGSSCEEAAEEHGRSGELFD